jgi:hypothetical protein
MENDFFVSLCLRRLLRVGSLHRSVWLDIATYLHVCPLFLLYLHSLSPHIIIHKLTLLWVAAGCRFSLTEFRFWGSDISLNVSLISLNVSLKKLLILAAVSFFFYSGFLSVLYFCCCFCCYCCYYCEGCCFFLSCRSLSKAMFICIMWSY